MVVDVPLDKLPAPVLAAIQPAKLQCAYHLAEKDRYIVELVPRQERVYDVALGRCLTDDERRAELPSPQRTALADFVMVTSYAIDPDTSEERVTFATDDGRVSVVRNVFVPLVWDGAQLLRDALRQQQFPAHYARLSREEKITHWAGVIHRWRRAHGESGRDEDEIYTPQLVRDLERHEPHLRGMLAEILTLVGALEQTPAAQAIAAFAARTGISVAP
jgi:hypothetical protein